MSDPNPSPILGSREPLRVTLPRPSMRELYQRLGFHYSNYSDGWDYEAWTGWMNGVEPRPTFDPEKAEAPG